MKKYLLVMLIFLIYQTAAIAKESVIISAMEDELARSMKELKLEDKEGPYYISYLVKDTYLLNIAADSGAVTANSENHVRTLKTNLRVGDYTLDNSNFLSSSNISSMLTSAGAQLTVDNDYDVLRRQIWLATDRAYKNAVDMIAKKKAALQNTVQTEVLPDFTKGSATSCIHPEAAFSVQKEKWASTVDQLSRLFIKQQQIQNSRVGLRIQVINSYYVNSEGARSIEPAAFSQLAITATTQAEDGMPVGNLLFYTASDPKELPELKELSGDVNRMIDELLMTRTAPVAEDYNGPILFVGQAAAELFGQGIGNFLLGRRVPLADDPRLNSMIGLTMGNPFLTKINGRVAAKFLSIKAVPTTLKDFNGKSLLGAYEIDEEGVPCQDVPLIENGMLKNLLTTRIPVKGFAQSNGHSRDGIPTPSVIHITSTNTLSPEQLKHELINVVEDEGLPYGYMVKGLIPPSVEAMMLGPDIVSSLLARQQGPPGPTQFKLTKPYSIFRVYPDGKEELVRGLEFRSHSINILKKILATSDNEIGYNYPANAPNVSSGIASTLLRLLGGGGASGQNFSTVITPSFLISEIDMKKITGNFSKPPIVDYPMK